MGFGQLKECNMRTIFLEKTSTKCDGETSPKLFSGKLKSSISLDQWSKNLWFLFVVSQVEGYQNTLKLRCKALAFTSL